MHRLSPCGEPALLPAGKSECRGFRQLATRIGSCTARPSSSGKGGAEAGRMWQRHL